MVEQILKKGYKQTELGVIPEDWSIKKFEDVIAAFLGGQTPSRTKPEYFKGNIPWITSGELNYNIIKDTIEKITPEGAQRANLKILPKGTFLFSIIGLEAEGTRGTCAITGVKATANQSTMALFPKEGILTTLYLFYFYVAYGKRLALKYCQGTKQQNYTACTIKRIPIIIPPTIGEQTAIVKALSDNNAFIESLDKIIKKKKNIKKGVMQALLTGKKRLPGEWKKSEGQKSSGLGKIPEDWEVANLGEISTITRLAGAEYTSTWKEDKNGEIIALRGFNIGQNRIIEKDIVRISNKLSLSLSRSRLCKGDVIYPCVGTIGNAAVVNEDNKYHIQQNIARIMPSKEIDSTYLAYYLMGPTGYAEIWRFNATSSQPNVLVGSLRQYRVPIPRSINEQQAISTILSNIYSEIEGLEQKRDKYKQLKIGLMQQLLTGRIRLNCKS